MLIRLSKLSTLQSNPASCASALDQVQASCVAWARLSSGLCRELSATSQWLTSHMHGHQPLSLGLQTHPAARLDKEKVCDMQEQAFYVNTIEHYS